MELVWEAAVDGYIRNKQEAIRSHRKTMIAKYCLTWPLIIFIPIWIFGMLFMQAPQKWKTEDVLYAGISQEQIGLQRGKSWVLNTQSGRQFVIPTGQIDPLDLDEVLEPGQRCTLVYSQTLFGVKHIEAFRVGERSMLIVEDSILKWEQEQRDCRSALWITIILELIALTCVDRLWCKQEYRSIKKLQEDIARREEKIAGNAAKREVK